MPVSRALMAALRSRLVPVVVVSLAAAGAAVAAPAPAQAATGFSAGDLVVYRVGAGGSAALSSSGTAVFLDEFSPAGGRQQSVALPTAATGSNKRLVASGSAGSEGELNLSGDGRFLVAAGYNAAVGATTPGGGTASAVPRTVALVGADDSVDTSTSLTDAISLNNVRGATSQDGSGVYVTGADSTSPSVSGLRYAVRGASTSTPLTSTAYTNLRDTVVAGGQLYASADPTKNSSAVTVAAVGSGLPTSGTNAITNLRFDSPPASPYAFSFLTLGTGTAPDTVYVADNATPGLVSKYALVSGSWVKKGAVALSGVTGVTANDVNGVAQIFATTASGLYSMSDASGQAGTLSGSATKIATPDTNTAFRGVAFAPGTVIGSGPGTPPVVPIITAAYSGLPAALDDPTNATDAVTVADDAYATNRLTVTATSSNQQVVADSGLSVTGTGGDRTLTATPAGAVGTATITLTVAAPDGQKATTSVAYAVSADQGDAGDRYYSGVGNASAAIDMGAGYALVGDDESDVLRLYDTTQSGPPVATFDFTAKLPFGTAEVDIEGAARVGDTIYWTGSMSNNSKGNVAPARSTVFATTVSGSGASTSLTYAGAYTGLQNDMVAWDDADGHGLGARYLGFDDSVNGGIANHADNSFNVEGLEFSGTDPSTAYFAFRGPLEPTTNRHLALVVPVRNLPALVAGNDTQARFGAPILWNLGGLGIRDIRRNADGDYLVLAGTATDANDAFRLYTWDGDPADPPLAGQSLPLVPAGGQQASWEAIVATPDPLTNGSSVRLIQDNGTTAWYGDNNTSKNGLPIDLQKDLSRVFGYTRAPKLATSTTITSSMAEVTVGDQVTYTATVAAATGSPSGTVAFSDDDGSGPSGIDGCGVRPVGADGTATCTVIYPHTGTHQVVATYSGAKAFATSTSAATTQTIDVAATTTTLASDNPDLVTGQVVTFTATVAPAGVGGSVAFTADGAALAGCGAVQVDGSGQAQCTVADGFTPSSPSITATYSGDGDHLTSTSDALVENVRPADTTVQVTSDPAQPTAGRALTFTATVTPVAPGAGSPSGTASFTVSGPRGPLDCTGGDEVTLTAGQAECTIAAGQVRGGSYDVTVAYSGDAGFALSDGSVDATAARSDSTVTLSSAANPAIGGKPVLLEATVAPVDPGAGLGTPSGTVTFAVTGQSGSAVACRTRNTVKVVDGVARCLVPKGTLTATDAPYRVTATYSGDDVYMLSEDSLQQRVLRARSITTLTQSSPRTSAGDSVTFSAKVAAAGPAGAPPSGPPSIVVTDAAGDSVECDAGPGDAQQSRCTVPAGVLTKAGSPYTATATYVGDSAFLASSRLVRHVVR